MSKIKLYPTNFAGFEDANVLTINNNHTRAVFENDAGGQFTLTGTALKMKNGELTGGTVTKVLIEDADGGPVALATELNIKAHKLNLADGIEGFGSFVETLLAGKNTLYLGNYEGLSNALGGNDRVVGGKAANQIQGGRGDDILTGGGGNDIFYFENDRTQHDIITDADLTGVDTDSIEITGGILGIRSAHHGHDSVVRLEIGSTILLEGVSKDEAMAYFGFELD